MRTLLIAAVIATGIMATPTVILAPTAASAAEAVTQAEREAFRAGMVEGGGPVVRSIIKRYPNEYQAFETELLTDFKSGRLGMPELESRAAAFFGGLGDRMLADVNRAPDADLRRLVAAQVTTLKALAPISAAACQQFGENGQIESDLAIAEGDRFTAVMNDYLQLQIDVADAGARANVQRGAPTDEDLVAILKEYQRRGGSEAWLEAAGTGDFSKLTAGERCKASTMFLEAVLAQPDAAVARFMMQ